MSNLSLMAFGATEISLIAVFGTIFLLIVLYLCFVPLKSWFVALFAGCYIPSFRLISIKNKKLNVREVVSAYILSKKSNLGVSLDEIEALYLSDGNAKNVLKALNIAKSSNLKLDFKIASAIELASKDILSIVHTAINSKIIEVKDIKAFTQDNIEIITSAKISVKINLQKYLTGLGEEDLKNTTNAWIMENISKSKDHKALLKSPTQSLLSNIDLRVLSKNSMYEVLDISIGSINIGRDLNAENEIRSAEKEKIYAQIEAERRKNAEEIKELQMKTKTEEMKSQVLQAEAEVPMAISQAIKEGRFSVMDYYKLMNLQADTALRRAIINDNKKNIDPDDGDF